MTEKHKITNLEAHTRYVKKFKSNTEAARQFLDDEGLKKGKELEKKWAFRFLWLRSKWIKMNKGKSKRSKTAIMAFHNFRKKCFMKQWIVPVHAEACALVDTSMSGEGSSGRDSLDVPQVEKESLLSPLDVVSPRQRNRRTQALLSLIQEEAEENNITPSQLLGYLLHKENYVKDRPLAAVGMQLFHKESVDKEISLDDGLYMLSQYKLGRTSYTSLRQDLKLKVELPAHYKLMQHKNAIMPCIIHHYLMYPILQY